MTFIIIILLSIIIMIIIITIIIIIIITTLSFSLSLSYYYHYHHNRCIARQMQIHTLLGTLSFNCDHYSATTKYGVPKKYYMLVRTLQDCDIELSLTVHIRHITSPRCLHSVSVVIVQYHIMAGRAFVVPKEVLIMETAVFWDCDNR